VRISKPARPEVIRARTVLVSHLGQLDLRMIMELASKRRERYRTLSRR
jgi:hypothetical protein